MKNLKYFPFERNRYFYGKLLTVDDFETEQKYMNDKRRMLNRFLYGSGVVSGMNVVRIDDTAISVEMGLALDFSGREIVVETPVIKKLSMIEGFESSLEEEDSGYMYLCIEYSEIEKDGVHSITSANVRSTDDVEHNKFSESYRIFLTTLEPENEAFTTEYFYRDTQTVYWGNGIRIKQIIPKYVKTQGDIELKIVVENMGQQQPFAFAYDVDLTCLQYKGQDSLRVEFNEKDFPKAGKYAISYSLKAMSVTDIEGVVAVREGSLSVTVGEKQQKLDSTTKCRCKINSDNPKKELINQYYKTSMEEIVKNTFQQSIYLAKIRIIKAGSAYVIEGVENMPFNQYVYNNCLSSAISDIETAELEKLEGVRGSNLGGNDKAFINAEISKDIPSTSTGTVTIDLGIGGKEGQTFITEPIAHGLGLGPVFIVLGQAYSTSDDSDRIFGNPSIFENVETMNVADIEIGARTDLNKGTFVIGAKMISTTNARKVRIDWMAMKDRRENIHDVSTKKLLVKPDMKDINVRESCYFEAAFTNVADQRIKWSVKEIEGGVIDSNGMYTAPNTPGVYEILVTSLAHPELTGSTYVVVREPK